MSHNGPSNPPQPTPQERTAQEVFSCFDAYARIRAARDSVLSAPRAGPLEEETRLRRSAAGHLPAPHRLPAPVGPGEGDVDAVVQRLNRLRDQESSRLIPSGPCAPP